MTSWAYLVFEVLIGIWCWAVVYRALTRDEVVVSGRVQTRQKNSVLYWLIIVAFGIAALNFPVAIADQLGAFK